MHPKANIDGPGIRMEGKRTPLLPARLCSLHQTGGRAGWALCTPTLSPCCLGQQLGHRGTKDAWGVSALHPLGPRAPRAPAWTSPEKLAGGDPARVSQEAQPSPQRVTPASLPPGSSQEPDSWCEGRGCTSTSGVRPAPAWGASLMVTGTRRGLCRAWWEGFCLLFHPCLPSNVPLKKQQDREKVNY